MTSLAKAEVALVLSCMYVVEDDRGPIDKWDNALEFRALLERLERAVRSAPPKRDRAAYMRDYRAKHPKGSKP